MQEISMKRATCKAGSQSVSPHWLYGRHREMGADELASNFRLFLRDNYGSARRQLRADFLHDLFFDPQD
jgi:hypothetical protein